MSDLEINIKPRFCKHCLIDNLLIVAASLTIVLACVAIYKKAKA